MYIALLISTSEKMSAWSRGAAGGDARVEVATVTG